MKKIQVSLIAFAMIAFIGCKNEKKDMDQMEDENTQMEEPAANGDMNDNMDMQAKTINISLESKSGSTATGKVSFTEENGMVKMEAKFSGLNPGTHAIHLHEKADCSAADGSSAGGHWNPTNARHGKWGDAEGYHKGDIGNFEADKDGIGTITMQTDEWCIGCGDENKDIVGKSVIVHEGKDDFVSQPSGNAGNRVSCGGIIK